METKDDRDDCDEWDNEEFSGPIFRPRNTRSNESKENFDEDVLTLSDIFEDEHVKVITQQATESTFNRVDDSDRCASHKKGHFSPHLTKARLEEQKSPEFSVRSILPWGPRAQGDLQTKENFDMYKYLQRMPECVRSMELGRSTSDHGEPLKDIIIFAMHHIDGKTLGGLCVLREWGARTMYNVFVGYNPTVIPRYFDELSDVDPRLFQATILVPVKSKHTVCGSSVTVINTAEATYRLPESAAEIRCKPPLPIKELNRCFLKNGPGRRPMTFLQANRCLAGFLFLRALAEAIQTSKHIINFEDGGYIHPMIELHVDESSDNSVKRFRKVHGIPPEPETDAKLGTDCLAELIEKYFVGTCELTRNGYNSTVAIWEKRQTLTGQGYLNTRFFSIAASHGKIKLEGNNIVLACLNGLQQVMYSIGWSLSRRKIAVLGARGNLGRLCCQHLVNITGDAEQPMQARRIEDLTNGFVPKNGKNDNVWGVDVKVNWPKSKPEDTPWWLEAPDLPIEGIGGETARYKDIPKKQRLDFEVIFGWTGGPTVDVHDPTKRHGTYDGDDLAEWLLEGNKPVLFFASGSTKTAEFKDVVLWITCLLERPKDERIIKSGSLSHLVCVEAQPIPDQLLLAAVEAAGLDQSKISRNFGHQYAFTLEQNGQQVTKVVYLVNNTMPLNFMFYGTATEIMDRSYAQVTSATAKLANTYRAGSLAPGIYPTDYAKESTDGVHLALSLHQSYNFPPSSGIPAPAMATRPK